MLVTENFLKARKDKHLSNVLVIDRPQEGKIIRLCIDAKIPYTDRKEMVFVECPTEIMIDNYSYGKKEVKEICFHTFFSRYSGTNYVETFLNAIKKDSDVSFRVVAFNGSDWSEKNNLVCHQLIGCIGEQSYLLAEYVGNDNTASPIKWVPIE